jgi:membrane protein DedA with SNARE-associated domain
VTAALFDRLTDLVSASAWTYLIVFALVAADAVVPLVPGETTVITAALLATSGNLSLPLVALAAFAGGFAGDNASFAIGARFGERAARFLLRGGRDRRLLAWARHQLEVRTRMTIVVARFLPGGRTATTFAAGTVGLPWRRFAAIDAVAAAIWAGYVTGLGYLGGETFRDDRWKALAASLALAGVIAVAAEVVRRARSQRASGA